MDQRLIDGSSVSHPGRRILSRVCSSNSFLGAILLLAVALRITHVLAFRHLPLFEHLIVDSQFYDKWAQTIAAGDWMGGNRAFYYDPLYPYVLAFIYRLFGHDLLIVRLFQVALGVATCGLVAVIGRRVGGKAVGNLAALMLAIYKPTIFQEGEVEKTALGVFLVTAALLLVMRPSLMARLVSGICLGLATLTRGNMLLLAPLGTLYLLVEPGNPGTVGAVDARRLSLKNRLLGQPGRNGVVFLLGVLVVLVPVTLRNHMVSGEWILTTYGGGATFYTGNNPDNSSGGYEFVPFVRPQSGLEENDFMAEAEARTGRKMGPSEVSSFWFAEGLKHIAAHPGFAARLFLQKFVIFWSNFEIPDAWDIYFLARYSPVLAMPLLSMGLLLPLAVLGTFAKFRECRNVRLLTGYIVTYSLSVVAFFVFSRYRIHVVPALTVLAASLLPLVLEMVSGKDLRRGLTYCAVAALIAFFSFFGVRTFGLGIKEYTHSFINLAGLYSQEGEFQEAEKLLEEALEKQRGVGQAGPLCALGELSLKTGNFQRAIELLVRCIRLNPGYPDAFMRLGMAYEGNGMPNKAAEAYELQLRLVPGHRAARLRLAILRSGSPQR